jgi:hypothetical protein
LNTAFSFVGGSRWEVMDPITPASSELFFEIWTSYDLDSYPDDITRLCESIQLHGWLDPDYDYALYDEYKSPVAEQVFELVRKPGNQSIVKRLQCNDTLFLKNPKLLQQILDDAETHCGKMLVFREFKR